MLNTDLAIFFDESGKSRADKVQLMGGLALPYNIYFSKQLDSLHQLNLEYRYHWSEYKGDSKQRNGILKLFRKSSYLAEYAQLNFIRYSSSDLAERALKYNLDQPFINEESKKNYNIINKMIYTKLPERIMYGLLRGYSHTSRVTSSIFIEHANEYETFGLAESMLKQLNIHSLYRGESFVVRECIYRRKGEEIGVDFIDILLGIVRTILENPDPNSRKKKNQLSLIIELLKENVLQPFISQLRLFELKDTNELYEVDVSACVKLFIAKNFEEYSEMKV